MATQTIGNQMTQPECHALSCKLRDFFDAIAGLLSPYINAPMRLDILDEKYRTRLTAYERVEIDRDLHRM